MTTYYITYTIFLLVLVLLLRPRLIDHRKFFHVDLITHSIGSSRQELMTYYLRYPRFIHSEMMTHKDFSRSASSSRAIPIMKMIKQVWSNPAIPIYWGRNQAGMQAKEELPNLVRNLCINLWTISGKVMCVFVLVLYWLKLHKQIGNRLLEPWQIIHVTLTTAKLNNFFALRIHKDAQPEIQYLAKLMKSSYTESTPNQLTKFDWHLPWIKEEDIKQASIYLGVNVNTEALNDLLIKISAARCARSSYANFDGSHSVEKDLETFDKLITTKPVHASPCEHQAYPDTQCYQVLFHNNDEISEGFNWSNPKKHGNLTGWIQHRKLIKDEYIN